MIPTRVFALTLVLASAALAPQRARAQEDVTSPPAPITPTERKGWTVSLAGGFGDIHVFPEKGDEVLLENGESVGGTLGAVVSDKLLALAIVDWMTQGDTSHSFMGVGVQWYQNQRIWWRAGVGATRFHAKADPVALTPKEDRWSGGALAGFGVEWLQFRKVALGSELEWMYSPYPNKDKGNFEGYSVSLKVLTIRWFDF